MTTRTLRSHRPLFPSWQIKKYHSFPGTHRFVITRIFVANTVNSKTSVAADGVNTGGPCDGVFAF